MLRIIFILVSFLCLNCNVFAENVSSKQSALREVNKEIRHIKRSLLKSHLTQDELQKNLAKIELTISQLNQENLELSQQIKESQNKLGFLQNQRVHDEIELDKQRQIFAKQINALYQLGTPNTLKIILTPDNLNTVGRHIYYFHYLNEARSHLENSIQQSINAINQDWLIINQQQEHLITLYTQKQQQQAALVAAQKNRKQILAQLDLKVEEKQQQLSTLLSNQKSLQDTLNDSGSQDFAPQGYPPFHEAQGKLVWPLQGAVSPTYGHYYVLIKHGNETAVRAIYAGKVVFANWLRGFGLLVIINHGGGYMSLYGRNASIHAKVGDMVIPGEVIAQVEPQDSDKSSLYFEIRHNGNPVNPHNWCRNGNAKTLTT